MVFYKRFYNLIFFRTPITRYGTMDAPWTGEGKYWIFNIKWQTAFQIQCWDTCDIWNQVSSIRQYWKLGLQYSISPLHEWDDKIWKLKVSFKTLNIRILASPAQITDQKLSATLVIIYMDDVRRILYYFSILVKTMSEGYIHRKLTIFERSHTCFSRWMYCSKTCGNRIHRGILFLQTLWYTPTPK